MKIGFAPFTGCEAIAIKSKFRDYSSMQGCLTFFDNSPSLDITAPRERSDLLILDPSLRVFPVAPVAFCLSDPVNKIINIRRVNT
jgi:hypothetical protein